MSFGFYWRAIRSFWKTVMVMGVAGMVVGLGAAYWSVGKTEAVVQVMVLQTEFETQPNQYPFPLDTRSFAKSYATIVNSEAEAALISAKENSESSSEIVEISAVSPDATSLITITASGFDRELVLAKAEQAAERIISLEAIDSSAPYELVITQDAQIVTASNPILVLVRNVFGGAVAGVIIGAAIALVLSVSDNRIRSRSQVAEIAGVEVVLALPRRVASDVTAASGIPSNVDLAAASALQLAFGSRKIVFSSLPHASSSTPLAIAVAETLNSQGRTVALVSTASEPAKLTESIPGSESQTEAVSPDPQLVRDVKLFTFPESPTSGSDAYAAKQLVKKLGSDFEYVIVAAPPIDEGPSPAIFGSISGSIILTADAGKTPLTEVSEAVQYLEQFGETKIGVAIQGVPLQGPDADQYGPVSI